MKLSPYHSKVKKIDDYHYEQEQFEEEDTKPRKTTPSNTSPYSQNPSKQQIIQKKNLESLKN
jgi:hypothetical protein